MRINKIRTGGYMIVLNELANQVKKIKGFQTRTMRHARNRNMIIGAGIGSALGLAARDSVRPRNPAEKSGRAFLTAPVKRLKTLKKMWQQPEPGCLMRLRKKMGMCMTPVKKAGIQRMKAQRKPVTTRARKPQNSACLMSMAFKT